MNQQFSRSSAPRDRASRPWVRLSALLACLSTAACAPLTPPVSSVGPTEATYRMPASPGQARSPDALSPDRAAELAEGALNLLDPQRPGGPDYAAAARLSLLAADLATSPTEAELRTACFRTAARSALRSGDTALYIDAVERWERASSRPERVAGELAVHGAIRARLQGQVAAVEPNDPLLKQLLDTAPPGPVSAQGGGR